MQLREDGAHEHSRYRPGYIPGGIRLFSFLADGGARQDAGRGLKWGPHDGPTVADGQPCDLSVGGEDLALPSGGAPGGEECAADAVAQLALVGEKRVGRPEGGGYS